MDKKAINITVKKLYTDVDGNIVPKATLPADLQVKIPFYLFGQFDQYSHYGTGRKILEPLGGVKYYNYYVANSYDFLVFSGANQIRSRIKSTDLVMVFTDDVINPNFWIWIIISADLFPIASIFSSVDGSIKTSFIQYESIANTLQYEETIQYVTFDKLGNQKAQQINARSFFGPLQEIADVVRMDLEIVLSRYFGFYSYILFDTDALSFQFAMESEKWDLNKKEDFKLIS